MPCNSSINSIGFPWNGDETKLLFVKLLLFLVEKCQLSICLRPNECLPHFPNLLLEFPAYFVRCRQLIRSHISPHYGFIKLPSHCSLRFTILSLANMETESWQVLREFDGSRFDSLLCCFEVLLACVRSIGRFRF